MGSRGTCSTIPTVGPRDAAGDKQLCTGTLSAAQLPITCDARTQQRARACIEDTEAGNKRVDSCADEIEEESHDDADKGDGDDVVCKDEHAALNMPNAAASAAAAIALLSSCTLKSECMNDRRRTCCRVTTNAPP